MERVKIIEVKKSIFEDNNADADRLRKQLKEDGTFLVNLMSSPGSGKTTTLKRTISLLSDEMKIGVMEADIDSDVDAVAILETGTPAIQIHTGGMCHLDADMTRQGLSELGSKELDVVFLENVGNLVCPAEFAVGEDEKGVVLSITEGDDKPMKYPLIFKESAIALLNKVDILPYCNFDMKSAKEDITTLHPDIKVVEIACTTGQGIEEWCNWLLEKIQAKKGN